MKGVTKSEQAKKNISLAQRKIKHPHIGIPRSPDTRKKISEAIKKLQSETDMLKKWMISNHAKPNKAEVKLGLILKQISEDWRFVGDGKLIIDGKCPDFWEGGNRLVELYGDYWHKGQDPQNRIDLFKEQGYETMVIWERELKDIEILKDKLIMSLGVV